MMTHETDGRARPLRRVTFGHPGRRGVVVRVLAMVSVILAASTYPTSVNASELVLDGFRAEDQFDVTELIGRWVLDNALEEFAGLWRDPGSNSLVVGFSKNGARHGEGLKRTLPQRARFDVREVQYSIADLTNVQARVDSETAALRAQGVNIVSTGLVPADNRVEVGVIDLTDAEKNLLIERYGRNAVQVKEGEQIFAADRDNVGPPWVGGMTLLGTCETSDCFIAGCTANFVTYDFISGIKFFNIMTAGHCFPHLTQVVDGIGKPVGSVTQRFFADGVTADVEEIDIATGTQSHKIIRSDPTQQSVLALRTVRSTADVVCKSGITTNQTCSWDVTATNVTINPCTDPPACTHFVELRSQMRAVRSSSGVGPGDSGGPVYATEGSGVRAHGIVSAATADGKTMYYSFMSTALNLTDTFICTPSSCP